MKSHKVDRARIFNLETKKLKQVEHWLSKQREIWERQLDSIDQYLKTKKEEDKES